MSRITVRLDDSLKNEFKALCNKRGSSMSDEIKEFVGASVDDTMSSGKLPEEDTLAKAYSELWKIRAGATTISVEEAENHLSNCLNQPSLSIRRQILQLLRERGYITVRVGTIILNVELDDDLMEVRYD